MEIKTRYEIGDSVFTIRDNKIQLVEIVNYSLEGDIQKNLEERLVYVTSIPKNMSQVTSFNMWYNSDDKRKESELFVTIEELLENLKDEYRNR